MCPPTGTRDVALRVVSGNAIEGSLRDRESQKGLEGCMVQIPSGTGSWPPPPELFSCRTGVDGVFRIAGVPPGISVALTVPFSPQVRTGIGPREEAATTTGAAPWAPEPVTFDGVGGRVRRDLWVEARPGILVTYRLVFPAGERPRKVVMSEASETEDPEVARWRGAQEMPAGAERASSSSWSVGEKGRSARTMMHRAWEWKPEGPAPEITLFVPKGRGRLIARAGSCEGASRTREVAGVGPPEQEEIVLAAGPRMFVQLADESGAPQRRAGVTIEQGMTVRCGAGSSGGGRRALGMTDGEGRLEVTEAIPPLGAGEPDVSAEDPGRRLPEVGEVSFAAAGGGPVTLEASRLRVRLAGRGAGGEVGISVPIPTR